MRQSTLQQFKALPKHEQCLTEYKALYDRARTPQFDAEEQGLNIGAYSLIPYLAPSGAFEFVWNAHDALPLGCIDLAATGEHACAIRAPLWFPEYVPAVGERVLVEMTKVRAKVNAIEHITKLRLQAASGDSDAAMRVSVFNELVRREGSEDKAYERLAARELQFPDLLVVTSGWLESLATMRERAEFFLFMRHSECLATIDRLHAEGRMNDESYRQMKGAAERGSTEWVAFQPMILHTGYREPGTLTMGVMFDQTSGDKHVSELVRETVLSHARQHQLMHKDGCAATYPPSAPGSRVLASAVLFDGALPMITMIDRRGVIGTTFVTAANLKGPQWQCSIRHESEARALDYHREMEQFLCQAFNTRSTESIDVYDITRERGEA